jgi:hypothetical protein
VAIWGAGDNLGAVGTLPIKLEVDANADIAVAMATFVSGGVGRMRTKKVNKRSVKYVRHRMRFNVAAEAAVLVGSGCFKARRAGCRLVRVGQTERVIAGHSGPIAVAHTSERGGGMQSVVLLLAQTGSMRSGAVADGNKEFCGRKIKDLGATTC